MTLAEVFLYLADPKEVTPDGHPLVSDGEILAEWAAWQDLSPLERLRRFER
jgi:hypothetical protein